MAELTKSVNARCAPSAATAAWPTRAGRGPPTCRVGRTLTTACRRPSAEVATARPWIASTFRCACGFSQLFEAIRTLRKAPSRSRAEYAPGGRRSRVPGDPPDRPAGRARTRAPPPWARSGIPSHRQVALKSSYFGPCDGFRSAERAPTPAHGAVPAHGAAIRQADARFHAPSDAPSVLGPIHGNKACHSGNRAESEWARGRHAAERTRPARMSRYTTPSTTVATRNSTVNHWKYQCPPAGSYTSARGQARLTVMKRP